MVCRDMMNRTIRICFVEDSIDACAAALRHPSVPMLMVLDEGGALVGVLTRATVFSAQAQSRRVRAGDVMATELLYCEPDVESEVLATALEGCSPPVAFVADGATLLGWVDSGDLRARIPWGSAGLRSAVARSAGGAL